MSHSGPVAAFTSVSALSFNSTFVPCHAVTPSRGVKTRVTAGKRHLAARMEVEAGIDEQTQTSVQTQQSPDNGLNGVSEQVWPPSEMTEEWAEAIERLVRAVPNSSRSAADAALDEADGDEPGALRLLMDENWSDIRRQRELVVEKARASGDVNRVSAVKEAELRRRATGSAQDFFKSYVETEGTYVDAGYVDEDADVFGKMKDGFKNLFGGGKK